MSKFLAESKVKIFLLILIPFIIFFPAVNYEFVWDDYLHQNHPSLQKVSTQSLLQIWQKPYVGMYIPVSYTTWALLKNETGFNPYPYHLANITLHILNGLLVFALLHYLSKNPWGSFFGTLLFLLHPLQVESVAWVSELRGLLSSFLGLSALLLFLIYIKERAHISLYIIATLFLLLSLLAKPLGAVIPLFAATLAIFFHQTSPRKLLLTLSPWIIITLIIVITTKLAQPTQALEFVPPIALRPFIFADAFNFYLSKLLWPFNLCVSYGRTPEHIINQSHFLLAILPLLALSVTLYYQKKLSPLIVPLAIFILGFLPVSGLIPFAFQNHSTVADRYLYLSLLGPALLLSEKYSKKYLLLAIILIFFLSYRTHTQLPTWQTPEKLWHHAITSYPNQTMAYNNLGKAYEKQGNLPQAIQYYEKALHQAPNSATAHNNIGTILEKQGKINQALEYYQRSLNLDIHIAIAHYNIANALEKQGKVQEAIKHYKQALKIEPHHLETHNNLGTLYAERGKWQEAIYHYREVLAINPRDTDANYNMARVYLGLGQLEETRMYYEQVLEAEPGNKLVREELRRLGD